MTAASTLARTLLPMAFLVAAASQAAAQPRVVASIMPVHSLVAGVMDGVATPGLLVQGAASPHTYSLRPSDAKRLNEGKVVFWIGEIYEGFLEKPLEALAKKATVVELMEADGVTLLPARIGGTWAAHEHGKASHGHAHDAKAEEMDGHLFLDIDNAKAIVRAAATTLVAADSVNKDRYTANAAKVTARLDALDAELRATLAPVKDRPFVVFHDAYQYVELRYGLRDHRQPRAPARRQAPGRSAQEDRHAQSRMRLQRAAIRARAGAHRDRGHQCQDRHARPARRRSQARARRLFRHDAPPRQIAERLPARLRHVRINSGRIGTDPANVRS
jgi:zinc transport system substrate-binding protein